MAQQQQKGGEGEKIAQGLVIPVLQFLTEFLCYLTFGTLQFITSVIQFAHSNQHLISLVSHGFYYYKAPVW